MINRIKRFRLCVLKKHVIKKEGTLANLKFDICNEQTIKCINNFHICFIRVWIKSIKIICQD